MKYSPTHKFILFITAILCIWSTIVLFPGSYSIDSWQIFEQVKSGAYNDWHAPVYTFIWRILTLSTGQYFSLFIVQTILFWVIIFRLIQHVGGNIIQSSILLITVWLFIFIPQYVIKDSLLVILWGLACIILLSKKQSKWLIILSIILISVGATFRLNNIPVAALLFIIAIDKLGAFKYWKKLIISATMCLLVVGAYQIFTYKILHTSKAYPQYKLMLLDLSGISVATNENQFPNSVKNYPHFNIEQLKAEYTPATIDNLYWPENGQPSIFPPPSEQIVNQVSERWLRSILHHPLAYIKNRAKGFVYYLRLKKRYKPEDYWNVPITIMSTNLVQAYRNNWESIAVFFAFHFNIKGSVIYAPWLWVFLNIIVAIIVFRGYKRTKSKKDYYLFLINLSGVLYAFCQLQFYQHDRDFRYSYWNVMIFILSIAYLSFKKKRPA